MNRPPRRRISLNPEADREDWRKVDAIFTRLLDVPEEERPERLAALCGSDAELHATLQHLLGIERQSRGAFARAAEELAGLLTADVDEPEQESPEIPDGMRRLGPYRLVKLLGRGGMSSVWLAERDDGQIESTVAIKVLHQWLDESAARRFLAERNILASLSHPSIAKLLDGGATDDGTPWLATEYVEGETLTRYCDQRNLGVRERLDVFLQIADAVQYAHQQLVVHRDLKPSNILVDRAGRVRLLDFGIAKLLEPDSAHVREPLTRTGHRPMTPEYAAPEQLKGLPITTATDVYQLGVVLFELLIGERPGTDSSASRDSGLSGLPKPSTVLHRRARRPAAAARQVSVAQLKGDLDVIVMKALLDDPTQRYHSVGAMAEDLRNHLKGRAISARPDTLADTARRFARRNPVGAAAVALAALAVFVSLGTLQISALRVAHERDVALREAARATEAKELLLGLFRQADPLAEDALRGRETTIWEAVESATTRVRAELHSDPQMRAEMLMTLAMLHHYAGRPEDGADLLEEVVELYRTHAGADSAPFALALAELGRHWSLLGRLDDGADAIDEALAVARRLPVGFASTVVPVLLDAGEFHRRFGSLATAENLYREAQALIDNGAAIGLPEQLAVTGGLAEVLASLGNARESESLAMALVATIEREFGANHVRLVAPLATLGSAQRELGRPDDAVASISRGLEILEREYGTHYASARSMRSNLSIVLAASGRPAEAVQQLTVLLNQLRKIHGETHPEVGNALQNLGVMLVLAQQEDEALARLQEARGVYAAAMPAAHVYHAFPLLTEAFVRLRRNEAEIAERAAGEALQILERELPSMHFAIGIARCLIGESLLAQGRVREANPLLEEGLSTAQAGPTNLLPYVENCRVAQTAVGLAVQ